MATVGSLFAGIGGFDLGFERSGFDVRWQVEQDSNAKAVLSARFPLAQLFDDVRAVNASNLERVDVICGGFPCQDVSVAGKREGLGGERTGLFWQVVRIAREIEPRWMVLENVPGLLSSNGGRDFYAVLAALADCGFRRSYRILDSRYFGVAQRRRRVFLVLRARRCGDGAETVLFEPEGSNRDSASGGQAWPHIANSITSGTGRVGSRGADDGANIVSYAIGSHAGAADGDQTNRSHASGGPVGLNISREVAYSLRSGRTQSIAATLNSGGNSGGFRTEPGEHLVCAPTLNQRMRGPTDNMMDVLAAMDATASRVPERARALVGSMHKRHDDDTDTLIPTLSACLGHHGHSSPRGDGNDPLVAFALRADPGGTGQGHNTTYPGGVRRLTPLECERLQGFPDGWTCLCGEGHRGSRFCKCPDSARYRQLGNAVTVNVAEWIAQRIIRADS